MAKASRVLELFVLVCSLEVKGHPTRPKAVRSGGRHTCALLVDGSLRCWGHGGDAERDLGSLSTTDLGAGRTAVKISVGPSHQCAILDNGALKCWGRGEEGQLGYGDRASRGSSPGEMGDALPAVDLGPGRQAVDVACGESHTCAVLDDGSLKCWGADTHGQLGSPREGLEGRGAAPGEMGAALPAVDLGGKAPASSFALAVAAGAQHSCALVRLQALAPTSGEGEGEVQQGTRQGMAQTQTQTRVKCFGDNLQGQLGYGDRRPRGTSAMEMGSSLPFVDLGGHAESPLRVAQLSAGGRHTCALLETGELKCWGHGAFGQLGQGDVADRGAAPGEMGASLPPVSLGSNRSVLAMALGRDFSCVLLQKDWDADPGTEVDEAEGRLLLAGLERAREIKCWGRGDLGSLGLGPGPGALQHRGDDQGEMGDALPPVVFGLGGVVAPALALSSGDAHACAVFADGSSRCWGTGASRSNTIGPLFSADQLRLLQASADQANVSTTTTNSPVDVTVIAATNTTSTTASASSSTTPTITSTSTATSQASTSTSSTSTNTAMTLDSSTTTTATLALGMTFSTTTTTTTTTATTTVTVTATAATTSSTTTMTTVSTTSGTTTTATTASTPPLESSTQLSLITWSPDGPLTSTSTTMQTSTSRTTAMMQTSTSRTATVTSTVTSMLTGTSTSTGSSTTATVTSSATASTSGTTLTLTTSSTASTTTSSLRTLWVAEATLSDSSLGFAVSGLPPDPMTVATVAEGQWAERAGVGLGDELLSINGRPVQGMSPPEVLQLLQESRPLALGWASPGSVGQDQAAEGPDPNCSSCAPLPSPIPILPLLPGIMDPDLEGESRTFQVNATALDTLLGFSPLVLNASTVLVAGVRPGLLADRAGVAAGDALLSINGRNTSGSNMSVEDILKAFQRRPLVLSFARAAGTIPYDLAVPPDADCVLVTASASETDVELGLFTAVMPPSSMRIVGVDSGRWAETSGMAIGDTVLTLNDKRVSAMAQREFIELMDGSRPLSIVFARCSPVISRQNETGRALVSALATMADTQLGFTSSSPPGAVYIVSVEVGLWADRAGMSEGDQLLTLNGGNVSAMSPNELLRHLQVTRPLSLVFIQGAAGAVELKAGNATTFVLVASLGDVELGFTPQSLPPGPVRIMDVSAGGWAQRAGILVGDRLLAVNGESMSGLSAARLIQLVQTTRPLAMLFARAATGPAGGSTSPLPGPEQTDGGAGSSTPPAGEAGGETTAAPVDEVAVGWARAHQAGQLPLSAGLLPLLAGLWAEAWTH